MPERTDLHLRAWTRDDLGAMADVVNARLDAEGGGRYATEASLAEQYDHLRNCDAATDIAVATDSDAMVAGFARTWWNDLLDGTRCFFIAFEGRDAATETSMFEWAVARAMTIASGHDHPDRRLDLWTTEAGRRATVVEAAGFTPYAWSAYMVRPNLIDLPTRGLPAGIDVRPVEPEHLRAIWEADVDAFRDHRFEAEQNETDFQRFCAEAAHGTELWQVAWEGDTVVGQVRTYVTPGEAERLGRRRAWTEDISTRRDWRGRGLASTLITRSLAELAELGYEEAALGVDLGNPTGALGVYERLGYQVVQRQARYMRPVA